MSRDQANRLHDRHPHAQPRDCHRSADADALILGRTMLVAIADRIAQRLEAQWCGLKATRRRVQGVACRGYEGGGRHWPVVVLIHGFTGHKHVWARFARYVVKGHRVLIPDLPGHGDTPLADSFDCSIANLAAFVLAWLDAQGVDRFHLIGSSMGGQIAAWIAANAPARVASLVVIAPAGVTAPVPSERDTAFATGVNIFLIESLAQFDAFYGATMARPPYVPRLIKRNLYEWYRRHRGRIERMHRAFVTSPGVETQLERIACRTQVIWGGRDAIVSPSAATVWSDGIRGSQLCVHPDLGHLPMLEAPRRIAAQVLQFLQGPWDETGTAP